MYSEIPILMELSIFLTSRSLKPNVVSPLFVKHSIFTLDFWNQFLFTFKVRKIEILLQICKTFHAQIVENKLSLRGKDKERGLCRMSQSPPPLILSFIRSLSRVVSLEQPLQIQTNWLFTA